MNEKQKIGSQYIVTFYNEIVQLNHCYSQYINLLLELEFKHGKDSEGKGLTDEEKNVLSNTVQTLRHFCNTIYIHYKSISKNLDFQENKEIDEDYKKIREDYILKRELLDRFVINVNSLLVKDVIQELLTTSQDIFKDIFETKNEPA